MGLGQAAADRQVEGVVAMLLDTTQRANQPLTAECLFGWHAAMFLTGYSGLYQLLGARGARDPCRLRWSRQGGQKKDIYFFCYGNQNERSVARQTA